MMMAFCVCCTVVWSCHGRASKGAEPTNEEHAPGHAAAVPPGSGRGDDRGGGC
jgi:hypothetical protein